MILYHPRGCIAISNGKKKDKYRKILRKLLLGEYGGRAALRHIFGCGALPLAADEKL